jgi:hypothetical protein
LERNPHLPRGWIPPVGWRARRLAHALLGAFLLGLAMPDWAAEASPASEAAVKAVLLFKLPQFAYVPGLDKAEAPGICILGNDSLGRAVEKLAQASAASRGTTVRQLGSAGDSVGCNFVYIGRGEADNLTQSLRQLDSAPLVTVSDIPGFASAGGMVEFAPHPERSGVQILINRRAASRQGIEFNAQLLRLAKIIEP